MKPIATPAAGIVRDIYRKLAREWGPQHWWPAESSFEVIVGAVLTQNTAWTNVEKAIGNLRAAGALSLAGVRQIPLHELERLIRPSGYFRQKSKRLKEVVRFVDETHGGSLATMLAQPTERLREQLLALNGIGPETADSILLYAGQHEVFVVDAYTRRVLERHGAIGVKATYDGIGSFVSSALDGEKPPSRSGRGLVPSRPPVHPASGMSSAKRSARAQVFNEMHGFFVQLGKHHCRTAEPRCEGCPLLGMLEEGKPISPSAPTTRHVSRIRRKCQPKVANRG